MSNVSIDKLDCLCYFVSMDLWNKLNDSLGNTILHPQYFMKKGEHETLKTLVSLAKKSKNPVFIDIGAGRQWYRNKIERYMSKYIALDHPTLSKHYQTSIDVFADIDKSIPLSKKSIDLALMIEVFEHLKNPQKGVVNIRKILKSDAFLIIHSFNNYPPHGFPPNYQRFTPLGLKNLLENNGFTVKKIKTFGNIYEVIAVYLNVYLRPLIFLYPLMLLNNILCLILGRLKTTDFSISYMIVAKTRL